MVATKTARTSLTVHPVDEASQHSAAPLPVETYEGRIYIKWNPQAAVPSLDQLPVFIEFLKTSKLFAPGCGTVR